MTNSITTYVVGHAKTYYFSKIVYRKCIFVALLKKKPSTNFPNCSEIFPTNPFLTTLKIKTVIIQRLSENMGRVFCCSYYLFGKAMQGCMHSC